jgi:putative membrane protein
MKKVQEKKLNRIALVLTIVILLVVGGMRRVHFDFPFDTSFLPKIYSILNFVTGLSLIVAFWFIRNKMQNAHQKWMTFAMLLSAVFLILYVIYHISNEPVLYCGEGIIRKIYFFLLITHVVLAAIILPLVLFTFIRAYTGSFDRHKKLARWVFPLWLYVALSGPICYFMLLPCYN